MNGNEVITRIFSNGAVWAAIIALANAIQHAFFPNAPQEIVIAANALVVAVLGAAGVYLAGQKDGYVKAMSEQGIVRSALIVGLLIVVGALVLANAPVTNAESPATERLAQEPALYCVALEVGLPADAVALAKVKFDTRYGFAHGIASADQWSATWGDRMQYFTDWLGVPNPTQNGTLKPWCARLVAAQARVLEP